MSSDQQQQPQIESRFKPDDIVLLKISGYKPWPSIVCPEERLPSNILLKKPKLKISKPQYPVYFLADGTFSWCNENQLTQFDESQVESFEKQKLKLKGVYKKSFEIAITNPKCEDVLPVYVDPATVAADVDDLDINAVEDGRLVGKNSRKTSANKRKAAATLKGRKKRKVVLKAKTSTTPSPAPVLSKRGKNKIIVVEESSSEEEEEVQEEEDEEDDLEEEIEIQQKFIPIDLDSKKIQNTIKKNDKQVLQLRLDLQESLLFPEYLKKLNNDNDDHYGEDKKNIIDKSDVFIKHLSKLSNMSQLQKLLESLSEILSNVNNYMLLKKYKVLKVLYLASSRPELIQFPQLKEKMIKILTMFDFEREEVGEPDDNWSASYKEDSEEVKDEKDKEILSSVEKENDDKLAVTTKSENGDHGL